MRADSILFRKQSYQVIRIGLGSLFLITGMIKAFDLYSFSKVIEAFAVLPPQWCGIAAMGVCLAEILFGFGLVMDIKGSLGMILVLLLIFVIILSHALYMGYDIDCGCFGPNDPESKAFASIRMALARDLFMITMIFYLYFYRIKQNQIPRPFLKQLTLTIIRSKLK